MDRGIFSFRVIGSVLILTALAAGALYLWTVDDSPVGYGGVYVETEPVGAYVVVDGDTIGTTPLFADSIPAGSHDLSLVMDGYVPFSMTFRARDGIVTRTGTLALERETADLIVETEPARASIWLDGALVGETPLTLRDIPTGEHTVLLIKPGYQEETHVVRVEAPELYVRYALEEGAVLFGGRWVSQSARDSTVEGEQLGEVRRALGEAMESRRWDEAEALNERLGRLDRRAAADTSERISEGRVADLRSRIREAMISENWRTAEMLAYELMPFDTIAAVQQIGRIRAARREDEAQNLEERTAELGRRIDDALSSRSFTLAAGLVRVLGQLDSRAGAEYAEKLREEKSEYVGNLARTARARWLEKDRANLDRVLTELRRVEPRHGAFRAYRHLPGEILRMHTLHTAEVWSVDTTPDGEYIVSGSYDDTIRLWDRKEGLAVRTLTGHESDVQAVCVSHDGRYIASGSDDATVKLWDLATGRLLRTLEGHRDVVWSVAFTHDGRYVVSGSYDKTIKVWDLETALSERPERTVVEEAAEGVMERIGLRTDDVALVRTMTDENEIFSVAVTPDDEYVVSSSGDDFWEDRGNVVRVWNLETGEIVHSFTGHTDDVAGVAVSPDGDLIASASLDGTVRLWAFHGRVPISTLTGHDGKVYTVAFTYAGDRLLSGGADGTVRVWRTARGGVGDPTRPIRTLTGHTASVYTVTITPDDLYIISGSQDRTIKVRRAPW